jgi:hypothetical protein
MSSRVAMRAATIYTVDLVHYTAKVGKPMRILMGPAFRVFQPRALTPVSAGTNVETMTLMMDNFIWLRDEHTILIPASDTRGFEHVCTLY